MGSLVLVQIYSLTVGQCDCNNLLAFWEMNSGEIENNNRNKNIRNREMRKLTAVQLILVQSAVHGSIASVFLGNAIPASMAVILIFVAQGCNYIFNPSVIVHSITFNRIN